MAGIDSAVGKQIALLSPAKGQNDKGFIFFLPLGFFLKKNGDQSDSRTVQELVDRHLRWLTKFWTPNRETYKSHADLILETDLRKAYEKYHLDLPEFLARGIVFYADERLY